VANTAIAVDRSD